MNSVFLDSDIVLDFYVQREPHHETALRLFTHLRRSRTRCFTSAVVIANVYYMLAKIESIKYALDKSNYSAGLTRNTGQMLGLPEKRKLCDASSHGWAIQEALAADRAGADSERIQSWS